MRTEKEIKYLVEVSRNAADMTLEDAQKGSSDAAAAYAAMVARYEALEWVLGDDNECQKTVKECRKVDKEFK